MPTRRSTARSARIAKSQARGCGAEHRRDTTAAALVFVLFSRPSLNHSLTISFSLRVRRFSSEAHLGWITILTRSLFRSGLFYKEHGSHRPAEVIAKERGTPPLARKRAEASPSLAFIDDEPLARGKRPRLVSPHPPPSKITWRTASASSSSKKVESPTQGAATPSDIAHPIPFSPPTPPSGWVASGLAGSAPLELSSFTTLYDPPLAPSLPFPLDPALGGLGLGLGGRFGGWEGLAPASLRVDREMSEQ